MTADSAPSPSRKGNALLAIGVGGAIAGTIDLLQACILFGWDIPLAIAGGLLGKQALEGGADAAHVLGVLLHFFIAFLRCIDLLRGEPQMGFSDRVSAGV